MQLSESTEQKVRHLCFEIDTMSLFEMTLLSIRYALLTLGNGALTQTFAHGSQWDEQAENLLTTVWLGAVYLGSVRGSWHMLGCRSCTVLSWCRFSLQIPRPIWEDFWSNIELTRTKLQDHGFHWNGLIAHLPVGPVIQPMEHPRHTQPCIAALNEPFPTGTLARRLVTWDYNTRGSALW